MFDRRHFVPALYDALWLLGRPHRFVDLGRSVRRIAFDERDTLPSIHFDELIEKLGGCQHEITLPAVHRFWDNSIGGISPYYYIGALARAQRPEIIVEFGTYFGLSTLVMALNTNADIFTIDLPDARSHSDLETLTRGDRNVADSASGHVGRAYSGHQARNRITELRASSLDIHLSDHIGTADLVLIDGGHSYELVKSDTENALSVLSDAGLVIWDDYSFNFPGLCRYLRSLSVPALRIHETQFMVYSSRLT